MNPILVVDDEAPVRRLVGEWLKGAGHSCVEAEGAERALEIMKVTRCPVAFVDIQMPGHDGLWLTRELRAAYPTTAIVLATAVSTVPPTISMQAGVLAYVLKPFKQPLLLNALDQAIAWHQQAAAGGQPAYDPHALDRWLDSL